MAVVKLMLYTESPTLCRLSRASSCKSCYKLHFLDLSLDQCNYSGLNLVRKMPIFLNLHMKLVWKLLILIEESVYLGEVDHWAIQDRVKP